MTSTMTPTPTQPAAVTAAVAVWFAAVGAGVGETLVRLVWLPDPPSGADLLVRFAIYAAVGAVVLALSAGRRGVRRAARIALAAGLGGIGTASLVVEPLTWLAGGGDPVAYLAALDVPSALVVALRALHIAAVAAAMALMFRPSASVYLGRGA